MSVARVFYREPLLRSWASLVAYTSGATAAPRIISLVLSDDLSKQAFKSAGFDVLDEETFRDVRVA
jgi:hypothetical protein